IEVAAIVDRQALASGQSLAAQKYAIEVGQWSATRGGGAREITLKLGEVHAPRRSSRAFSSARARAASASTTDSSGSRSSHSTIVGSGPNSSSDCSYNRQTAGETGEPWSSNRQAPASSCPAK